MFGFKIKPVGYGIGQNIYIIDGISCEKKSNKKVLVIYKMCIHLNQDTYIREAQAWVIKFITVWITASAL